MKHFSLRLILLLISWFDFNFGALFTDESDQVNKNVKVYFSTSVFEAYRYDLGNLSNLHNNTKFNKKLPIALYIHGFLSTGKRDHSAMAVRNAFRIRGGFNILVIDWKYYSTSFLYTFYVIPQLKIICETIAENLQKFLDLGYEINKIHLIGHSLGGQCIGLVGRHLKKISNNNYIIPRMYALDPAGPGFDEKNTLSKIYSWIFRRKITFSMISRDDAEYVQIIHTSAGSYGIIGSHGHVDFFPNSGSHQSGCDLEIIDDICSHRRAWIYFQESVKNPKSFPAIKCDSFEQFTKGNCKKNEKSFMGLTNDTLTRGDFYLLTHPSPYHTSLGENGIEFHELKVVTNDFEDVFFIDFKNKELDYLGDDGDRKESNLWIFVVIGNFWKFLMRYFE